MTPAQLHMKMGDNGKAWGRSGCLSFGGRMWRLFGASATALLLVPANLAAQQSAQQSQPAAAQSGPDLNGMLAAASSIAALVDHGRAGEVWDALSIGVKPRIAKDAFVSSVTARRKQLGAVAGRNWLGMAAGFVAANSPQAPAGQYVSVNFGSRFADNVVRVETISFRLDEDGTWRPSGYLIANP